MAAQDYFAEIYGGDEAGPSAGPKHDELTAAWRSFIDSHRQSQQDSSQLASHPDLPSLHPDQVPSATPWDAFDSSEDEESNESAPSSPAPSTSTLPARIDQDARQPAPKTPPSARYDTSLHDRIKEHLSVSSTFSSLIGLLSTSRSNEDIQSELVEILGFEGDGLSLVEQLLQPGARDRVVEESGLMGKGKKGALSNGASGFAGNWYLPSARLNVNATKGKSKKQAIDITEMIGSSEDIARRIHEQLDRPKTMFSEDGPRIVEQELLPHVYTTVSTAVAGMSMGGRFAMPAGTTRDINETHEEVVIPPSKPVPPRTTERPVRIADLPPLARGCFPSYVTLNRMQSIIQPTAMNTNENMLVCAPTGAGKTDVAIMSIIRVLSQHVRATADSSRPNATSIDKDAFKVIYVAPMKALAAEITRKFGKRLAWLGIRVRELTGDMQLTRQEIAETQIIVTTPEKWDVVTRKPTGEGELASKVKLLILDEVHLLNEERGAVIETIVARTLRQVESSQSLIRIVGLSATLPNYIDVSDFLRVNRYTGLFFFDASFRPVPLEQHFLGIQGKARSAKQAANMDRVVFDKVSELVQDGHQVMVFVHARKETVKTAQKLKEMAMEEGVSNFLEAQDHPKYGLYRREISTSRNKEMKELFDAGFGIHHAGMLRSDRNMMEKMFEDQAIKVLCCTSTLAWGVNLPAHAVIIKGTQVYDSSKGAFMDLSVLDVLQIFGRAGRPGYETSGVGYICTAHDKLDHYLYSIMAQHPIESKFIPGMTDSLNAEIALGTIANVPEAIQWLGYTYLFVRMRREPMIYGMSHEEPKDDPQLGNKRNALIIQAARQLSTAKMVRYDEVNNSFIITDLGRIAAKYYLKYQTIEIFNTLFHPKMKNADLFAMLSQATEFEQIQVRENEVDELTGILESDHCPMEVKGGVTSKHGKVNILLQAYISKVFIEDFALVSDSAYVAQNAARIIRALLEIAFSRNWANNAMLLIDLSKAIERRMWPYEHPLSQISTLHRDTLYNVKQWQDDTEIATFRDMEPAELGEKIHMNETHGKAVRDAARMFPSIGIECALRPLTHEVVQLSVEVTPLFDWNAKVSTAAEPFYIWIQDEEGIHIIQWRSVLIRQNTTSLNIDFDIPFSDTTPSSVTIVSASDRWLGSDTISVISLSDLVMPRVPPEATSILDIPYLHISALDDPELERSYRRYLTTMNSFQAQAFWTAYHTQANMLISAPVASGKSFLGEMSIWHAFRHDPAGSVMVLAPNMSVMMDIAARLRSVCPRSSNIDIATLRRSTDFDLAAKRTCQIAVTCPHAMLLYDNDQALCNLLLHFGLFVLEDLHLMDVAYELAVTRVLSVVRPNRARIVGITTSLNDYSDVADWLGVDEASRYSFYPIDRGDPVQLSVKSFTNPHSATLFKTMVKPAYDVIKASPKGVIAFAPSRSACRSIAADLVTQSGTEMDLSGFLGAPRADVEPLLQQLRDPALYEPLLHGIAYLLSTTAASDTSLILELFASGIVRALIVPREACWSLVVRAETVLLLGAQYIRSDLSSAQQDRQIVNYGRQELVRMQGYAIPTASPHAVSGRMFVMCQAEQAPQILRILNDGLPLESTFPTLLRRDSSNVTIRALDGMLKDRPAPPAPQINRPRFADLRKRDLMDLLTWSYFYRRAFSNPTYYDLQERSEAEGVSKLVDKWFEGREWSEVPSALGSVAPTQAGTRSGSPARKAKLNGASKGASQVSASNDTARAVDDSRGPALVVNDVVAVDRVGDRDGEALDRQREPAA